MTIHQKNTQILKGGFIKSLVGDLSLKVAGMNKIVLAAIIVFKILLVGLIIFIVITSSKKDDVAVKSEIVSSACAVAGRISANYYDGHGIASDAELYSVVPKNVLDTKHNEIGIVIRDSDHLYSIVLNKDLAQQFPTLARKFAHVPVEGGYVVVCNPD